MIHVRGAAVLDENNKLVQKVANKNAASARPVPIMIPELHSALTAVKDKTGLVVQCHANHLWDKINDICKENNFPLVGVHGLRRSFVSLAYHIGIDEDLTMDIGGWSDTQTMRRHYKRLAKSDVRKQTQKFINFYRKIAPAEINAAEAVEILAQQRELFRLNCGEFENDPKVLSAYTMAIETLSKQIG